MSKILRKSQKIFGSTAGANQIVEFGSLAAGSPVFTTDPAIIQTLSNYLQGWFGAVVGANSPAIEDMNAICYLYAYQIAYLMQAGVSEWDSGTTYYIGSIAQDGSGNLYISLTNTNINNALTDFTKWKPFVSTSQIGTISPNATPTYTMTSTDIGRTFLIHSSLGALQMNLPAPSVNYFFYFKDADGSFLANPTTLHRNGAESIEGLAADYVASAPYGEWKISSDGTNWYITGR